MAGRMMALRGSRGLLLLRTLALRPLPLAAPSPSRPAPGVLGPYMPSCFSRIGQRQWMSSDVAQLPSISDADVLKALRQLLAVNWIEIPDEVEDAVESALSKKTDDVAAQEALASAWRAADAVEKFSGTLVSLRMELDELSGLGGEKVRPLPSFLVDALAAAFSRYNRYLSTFKDDEMYLKKKVEIELGSLMVHIRQRCSGLGPQWGNVSLLGTSGLSGSYIEHRAE